MALPRQNSRHALVRRGFTIVELLVSLAVLGTMLLLVGQLAATIVAMQRQSEANRYVAQEASNLAERLSAFAFDDLDNDRVATWIKEQWPDDGKVAFTVKISSNDADDGALRNKLINIAATHRHVAHAACELQLWKHALREESP